MQKDDQVRLRHMLEAAKEALSFAQNETRSSLDSDRKLELALVKSIEIIGEAAVKATAQGITSDTLGKYNGNEKSSYSRILRS